MTVRAIVAGVVGGIVVFFANFVLHGMILGPTYMRYPEVFTQEEANPLYFLLVGICVAIPAALLFAKSRAAWADGLKGGLTFGAFLGAVYFFLNFYQPLVMKGFPYYLSWCWGGTDFIDALLLGAVLGVMVKRT